MRITISNQAGIPNKYIRLIKWKIRQIKDKFKHLMYLDVYITKEGIKNSVYKAVLKLGVPGNDIIITNDATEPSLLWKRSFVASHRYLRKYKEKYNN